MDKHPIQRRVEIRLPVVVLCYRNRRWAPAWSVTGFLSFILIRGKRWSLTIEFKTINMAEINGLILSDHDFWMVYQAYAYNALRILKLILTTLPSPPVRPRRPTVPWSPWNTITEKGVFEATCFSQTKLSSARKNSINYSFTENLVKYERNTKIGRGKIKK